MGIKYLPAIDGLRAVAVLSVIAYHVGAPAGYVGVDVFFVISGYLITKILLGDPGLLTFYARRARRILPAAFLVVLVTLGLSFLLLPSTADVARSAAAAGVFVANVYFQSATGGYWDASADTMPLLHLWSLSVEEQFYLVWPVLLLFVRRARWLCVLAVASLALYASLMFVSPEAAFYQTPARAWELAAGGLVALWSAPMPRVRKRDVLAVNVLRESRATEVGVGVHVPARAIHRVAELWRWIVVVMTNLTVGTDHGHPRACRYRQVLHASKGVFKFVGANVEHVPLSHGHPVSFIAPLLGERPDAVLQSFEALDVREDGVEVRPAVQPPVDLTESRLDFLSGDRHSEPRALLLDSPILRNLSSLVLQHTSHIGLPLVLLACLVPMPVWLAQPIAVLGATMLVAAVHAGKPVPILASRPLVYVGLISYSLYLWHWPLLAIDRSLRIGDAPLEVRLALVGIAFALAVLTYRYVETPFRRMQAKPRRAVAVGMVCAAALSCTAFVMADAPEPATPQTMLTSTRLCHPGTYKLQAPECVPEARKLVLWSDSYGLAWERHAERLAKQEGIPAVTLLETGCPAALTDVPRPTPRASQFCKERAERDFAYLQRGADTLLVTSHWSRLLRERPGSQSTVLAWAQGLPNVRRIIVVGASPELRDSVEKCQGLKMSCDIAREDYEKSAAETKALMAELAKLPNVEVWNIGDWLCDAKVCPGVRDGMPLYYNDGTHVSMQAVEAYVVADQKPMGVTADELLDSEVLHQAASTVASSASIKRPVKPESVEEIPTSIEFVKEEVQPHGCHNGDAVKSCGGETMVWGDSMAWAWAPLGEVANSRDNCPPLLGYPTSKFVYAHRCREFNDRTLRHAKKAKHVTLAAAWVAYPLPEIEKGLDATLSELRGNVSIIGPTPALRDTMPRCLRYGVEKCAVPRSEFDQQAGPVRSVLRRLAAKHGAKYIEPVDYFCNTRWCPALRSGKPLYWDQRHVSVSAVRGFPMQKSNR